MILIIDNYDSFTYNLYQLIRSLGHDAVVVKSDELTLEEISTMRPEKIVISPGPRGPEQAGISMDVIRHYYKQIPLLGVCLGHQCIGRVFGSDVVRARKVFHGKTSDIAHSGKGLFVGVENPLRVARYHSLAVREAPDNFVVDAWSNDGEIMALRHLKYPLYGIQFHPESFMTRQGDVLLRNFLSLSQ